MTDTSLFSKLAVEAVLTLDMWNPKEGDRCRITREAPEIFHAHPQGTAGLWQVVHKEWNKECGHMHVAFVPVVRKRVGNVGVMLSVDDARKFFDKVEGQ